jgi:hypothetical protein
MKCNYSIYWNIKDKELNQKILLILYTFTSLVFPIEMLQKHYKGLSTTKVMKANGNGFKNTNPKRYQAKEKRLTICH